MILPFPEIDERERNIDILTPRVSTSRVLVAEDNLGMLYLVSRALKRRGYDVLHARDGLELMSWVEQLAESHDSVPLFDMIVTDLRMPMFSGQDCLRRLQKLQKTMPVILITAFGDNQVHLDAKAAGARAVMNKPLDLDELCILVDRELR